MARSLYICYFGVRESLVQTQVIPYLRELAKGGHEVSLLTFEPVALDDELMRRELRGDGIEWHWLKYHKRLSMIATAYDIFRGAAFVWRITRRNDIEILHGRVHVPTLMAAIARKVLRRKPKLLFDIRGFFPEEYTDAGLWPENGFLYRSAKRAERWLLKEADGFIVLTEKARDILFPELAGSATDAGGTDKVGRPLEVIPCCVDMSKFYALNEKLRSIARSGIGAQDRFVITYVGSFGGWYLTDEMIGFFLAAKAFREDAFVLILTQRSKEKIAAELRNRGFSENDFSVRSVSPAEVPGYLGASDVGVAFIKACYSKQSSSPTKIAEYLAAGLPIVANRGIGDVDAIIEDNAVGVVLESFDRESYIKGLKKISELDGVADRAKRTATCEFDLEEVGGVRYRRIYARLLGREASV